MVRKLYVMCAVAGALNFSSVLNTKAASVGAFFRFLLCSARRRNFPLS